jgi:hypothetical protein
METVVVVLIDAGKDVSIKESLTEFLDAIMSILSFNLLERKALE